MRKLVFAALILLAACGQRGEVTLMPQARGIGTDETVFVGTTRGADAATGQVYGKVRAARTSFLKMSISVPPDRPEGGIPWPKQGRPADPMTEFVTLHEGYYDGAAAFRRDLGAAIARQPGGQREAIIFVHGFNNTFAEGVYRIAQLGHDLKVQGTLVHYSWPSRANPLGYVYDRDSAMYARDGLDNLIREVRAAGASRIIIVAHSMGSMLVMESLRDLAMAGDRALLSRISGVVLMSPDMDVDVFRQDARRIGTLPQPFLIFTSKKDQALRISALLTGQSKRVGNLATAADLSDLKVTIVDTTAFSTGSGHFNVGNSPLLLGFLNQIGAVETAFAGEQVGRTGLLGGAVLTVQNATQIILSPVVAIADQ